jgi:hypothetical protein
VTFLRVPSNYGFAHDNLDVHACEEKGDFMAMGIMKLTLTLKIKIPSRRSHSFKRLIGPIK